MAPLPVKHPITIQDGGVENLVYRVSMPALQARHPRDHLTNRHAENQSEFCYMTAILYTSKKCRIKDDFESVLHNLSSLMFK